MNNPTIPKIFTFLAVLVAVLSLGVVLNAVVSGKQIFTKNIDIAGGVSVTITGVDLKDYQEDALKGMGYLVKRISGGYAVVLEKAGETNTTTVVREIKEVLGDVELSIKVVGPAMGESFLRSSLKALAFGVLLMALIVFLTYRRFFISALFILVSLLTMVETFVLSGFLGIPLSPHSIGGLLMILGYSVDYQVLFASKRDVEFSKVFKTAATMFLTSIGAVIAIFLLASAPAVRELAGVLFTGIIINFINSIGITRASLERVKELG